MKKSLTPKGLIFLLGILIFSNFNSYSQTNIDRMECGFFEIPIKDGTKLYDFPLISTNIKAKVSGVIANVELEQVYVNNGDSTLNAKYVFPMSTNAAVYRMQMNVNGRIIEAKIESKGKAKELFEAAQDSGKTASLLEQERPNVFQMSLANILPKDTIKVKLTYTELIVPEKNIYQFVLPTIVGPRYTNANVPWSDLNDLSQEQVKNSELSIDIKIEAGMPLTVTSTSHPINLVINTTSVSGTLKTNPEKDFIIDYSLLGNEIQTGLLVYEGVEENFFLAMIQPPKPEVNFILPSREYVFILDVSGSMYGTPIEISKQLITNILEGLNENDKFNIVFFAGGSSTFATNSVPVTPENIAAAKTMISNIRASGGTEILNALKSALVMEGTLGFSRTFVILTDGYVTVEKQCYDLIRNNMGVANFFAFGIGSSVNREIIEGIAYVGEGETFVVTDLSLAQSKADLFQEYIEKPAFTNIQASFSGVEVYEVEPLNIPDVFADRPIIIYGKYKNAQNGSITLSGDYNGANISQTLFFDDAADTNNEALMYLWARKKIKLMSDYGVGSNEKDTLSVQEEITNLGLKYNLITDYTSFIAIEDSIRAPLVRATDGTISTGDDTQFILGFEFPFESSVKVSNESYIQIIGSNLVSSNVLHYKIALPLGFVSNEINILITDLSGNLLYSKSINYSEIDQELSQEIGALQKGLFLISLSTEKGVLSTEKFVKN